MQMYQINYDVITVLAPKRHSGIIYSILTLNNICFVFFKNLATKTKCHLFSIPKCIAINSELYIFFRKLVRPLPTSSSVTSLLAVTTSLATHEQTSEQPVTTSDKLQSPLFLQVWIQVSLSSNF